jgi:hypothetical protein
MSRKGNVFGLRMDSEDRWRMTGESVYDMTDTDPSQPLEFAFYDWSNGINAVGYGINTEDPRRIARNAIDMTI